MYQNQKQQDKKREEIVAEAMSWYGTPYHHAAKVKGGGVDCAQILIAVYSNVGMIEDFKTEYYPMDWALHRGEERYLSYILKYAEETSEPKKGDIVLYKFGRCISHAGILIDDEHIIHSWLHAKSVAVTKIEEGELEGRVAGYYTLFKKGK